MSDQPVAPPQVQASEGSAVRVGVIAGAGAAGGGLERNHSTPGAAGDVQSPDAKRPRTEPSAAGEDQDDEAEKATRLALFVAERNKMLAAQQDSAPVKPVVNVVARPPDPSPKQPKAAPSAAKRPRESAGMGYPMYPPGPYAPGYPPPGAFPPGAMPPWMGMAPPPSGGGTKKQKELLHQQQQQLAIWHQQQQEYAARVAMWQHQHHSHQHAGAKGPSAALQSKMAKAKLHYNKSLTKDAVPAAGAGFSMSGPAVDPNHIYPNGKLWKDMTDEERASWRRQQQQPPPPQSHTMQATPVMSQGSGAGGTAASGKATLKPSNVLSNPLIAAALRVDTARHTPRGGIVRAWWGRPGRRDHVTTRGTAACAPCCCDFFSSL
jgi:hypothetical protein